MYILDTNVISELRKAGSGKADRNVLAWASSVSADELYVSVITIMELELGVASIERKDLQQGQILRHWLENQVLPEFVERTLVIDTSVALCCARLRVPNKRSERDALIAATALAHSMTVVTRNVNDFIQTGAKLINPWEYPQVN